MGRRAFLSTLGLACIALLDAVLIGFSVQHVGSPASANGQELPVQASAPSPSAGPAPAVVPSTASHPQSAARRLALIDAASATVAIRASTPETCSGPPASAQITVNGGVSWTSMPLPAPYLLRLRTIDVDRAWIVAAKADCKPVFYRTDNGGQTWFPAASTNGAWHRLPGTSLHAPSANVQPPCGAGSIPDALSPLTATTAYVGCRNADGALVTLLETTRGGSAWTDVPLPPVGGPVSMAWPSTGTGFVAGTRSSCRDGVEVVRSGNNGESWSVAACVKTPDPGTVAISLADVRNGLLTTLLADGLWATWTTHDAGSTWTQVSG